MLTRGPALKRARDPELGGRTGEHFGMPTEPMTTGAIRDLPDEHPYCGFGISGAG
jgi:hypothetical protein